MKNGDKSGGKELNNTTLPLKIVSPVGGFGNHIRWLILLDKQFQFHCHRPYYWNYKIYKSLRQTDWPVYTEFDLLPLDIQKQICEAIPNENLTYINLIGSPEDKLQFIKNYVYTGSRSWHNWLQYEWLYRDQLDTNLVTLYHECPAQVDDIDLLLTIDPELAYHCYLKFNSNLNVRSKKQFIADIEFHNFQCQHLAYKLQPIDVTSMFSPYLSQEVYECICKVLNLENNTDFAKQLHLQWYNLHKAVEKKFVSDIESIYGIDKHKYT